MIAAGAMDSVDSFSLVAEDISARALLAVAGAGTVLALLVAAPLAVYPALIKFFPTTLATLAVPFRLAKALEFAYYVLSFAVLLPGSVWFASQYVAALRRRRVDPFLVGLANVVALMVTVAVAKSVMAHAPKIGQPGREHWVRPLSWLVILALVLLVAANAVVLQRPGRLQGRNASQPAWLLIPLMLILPLVFMPSSALVATRALVATAVAAVVLLGGIGLAAVLPRARGRWGIELFGVVVLVLLTWDLHLTRGSFLIRQAHWRTVYLGPANSVLHGGTMLVDVFAQYGPGTTYFLAGFFHLVSISFGHFWLLTQVLDVVVFVVVYAIFRAAGLGRVFGLAGAVLALLTGVIANPMVDTLVPERPMRIILPLVVLLLVIVAERRPHATRLWPWLTAVALAICSIWAIEVFFYALAIVVCALICRARLDSPARSLRIRRAELGRFAGTVVAAQLVFAFATKAASGAWPNWPRYLEYTRVYASGAGSQPFAPFQPGLLLALFYFTSAATLVVLLARVPVFMARHRVLVTSIAATTGLAIGYFSYYAGESQLTNTYKMAPAAVLLAMMWLAFALRVGAYARRVGLAFAFVGLWSVAVGMSAYPANAVHHLEHTALLSSPATTWREVKIVARSPVIDPRAAAASAFVRQVAPDREHVLVLLPEELTTEVLLRTKRVELIPMSDPYGENFLASRVAYLEQVTAQLPVGTQFVTNTQILAESRSPDINDLDALLVRTLRRHYSLHLMRTGPGGLAAYRLAARSG